MELDFKTVKALSSPTRITILREVLDGEATPTSLSREIGKSKSTVASHLTTLQDAGLVEKDEEEGRRRVVYRPTRKAKTIVKGRERKVRFSLAGAALSALGAAFIGYRELDILSAREETEAAAFTAEAMPEAGGAAASRVSETLPVDSVLALGAVLVLVAAAAAVYGTVVYRLGE